MQTSLNEILVDCAKYLRSKQNKKESGFGLNIEPTSQTSSIVNTAEAIYVMRSPMGLRITVDDCVDFIQRSILVHGAISGRHDCLRYYSFGVLGFKWAGESLRCDETTKAIRRITQRYSNPFGWSEVPKHAPSVHSSFFACRALAACYGWEYVNRKYQPYISSQANSISSHSLLCYMSYIAILSASTSGVIHKSPLLDQVAHSLNDFVKRHQMIEHESIAGTDWHHYSTCWAIRALLHHNVVNRYNYIPMVSTALRQLIDNWRPGTGVSEPGKGIVNVRSLFNVCVAIRAYLKAIGIEERKPKIFIIHGRDIEAANRIELFLRRINCDCVQLRLEASQGRTIISKLREIADDEYDYVVALMTADDIGGLRSNISVKPRARQNVLFELGYFLHKLQPSQVGIIVQSSVEIPSDLEGLERFQFEERLEEAMIVLARELSKLGLVRESLIGRALKE